MSKTIYTAIFGKYDELKEPFFVTPGWRYVCFTDQDFSSLTWEVKKVPVMPCGPAKTARYYKIMFHKHIETEFSIWIDGTFIININLDRWWRRFNGPFTAVKHPFDDCIYTDAKACISLGRGDKDMIERQVQVYRAIGIPEHNGLIASGVLMRQKTGAVNEFCRTWWNQVEHWSVRDQIAYGYANYQYPGLVKTIDWNYQQQKEFIHIPHLTKKWRSEKYQKVKQQHGKI